MYLIDWLFVLIPMMVVLGVTFYTQRYLKSVADFLAGGRLAGRYLLSTARGQIGIGAIGYVAGFEAFHSAGFAFNWWNQLATPVTLVLAITGFVVYRYRQTRVLTLAQFFEIRYGRSFRLFTGVLAYAAGLLNFGVIPVVGAKFMVYFLQLPEQLSLFSLEVPTYVVLLAIFLSLTTLIVLIGGQISIMIADCIQGMFSQIFFVIISVALFALFSWPDIRGMLMSRGPGESIVNPFDSFSVKDFNIWYVLMGLTTQVYSVMAWQNNQGFNSAAASPHESRMGYVLGSWRSLVLGAVVGLLSVSAATHLHQLKGTQEVHAAMAQIRDPQTAEQMEMPISLSQVLPIGIKGLFVSIVLMGILGGDGQALHSWGSIFIQDVVLPLSKRPLSPRLHIGLLRFSIIGVALFAFFFGIFFTQTEYLLMWWTVTMAIYIGGAGACIIGGLYWSRGTTAGAWTGLLIGSSLSCGGILLRQPASVGLAKTLLAASGFKAVSHSFLLAHLGEHFPLNGTQIGFSASLLALAGYAVVSLLTCRTPHNMDRLLHRGKYAVEPQAQNEPLVIPKARKRFHLYNIIGIDEHFTRGDRWATLGIFFWSVFWFGVFVLGSVWYLVHPWSSLSWANYWLITGIYLPIPLLILTTIWFTIGCSRDLVFFFRRLKTEKVDTHDDGTVPN